MTPPLPSSAVSVFIDEAGHLHLTGTERRQPLLALPRAEMERVLAALAFYANPASWKEPVVGVDQNGCNIMGMSPAAVDDGDMARAALPAEGATGAPRHTDLMVTPESIGPFLDAHPAPADAAPLAAIRRVLGVTASPADVAEVRAWLDGSPAHADAGVAGASCIVCGHVGERGVWSALTGEYACVACRDAGQHARRLINEQDYEGAARVRGSLPIMGEAAALERAFLLACEAVMRDKCDCNDRCVNDGLLEEQDRAWAALEAHRAGRPAPADAGAALGDAPPRWMVRMAMGVVMDQGDVTDTPGHRAPIIDAIRSAYESGRRSAMEGA